MAGLRRNALKKETPLRVKTAIVALEWALDKVHKLGVIDSAKAIESEIARLEKSIAIGTKEENEHG